MPASLNVRSLAPVLVAAALLSLPRVASAEHDFDAQTGSRLADRPMKVSPQVVGPMLKSAARCALKSKPAAVARLLENSDPMQVDFKALAVKEDKLFEELGFVKCMQSQMTLAQFQMGVDFKPNALRSLLLEEAYLDARPSAPRLPDAAVEQSSRHFVSEGELLKQAQGLAAFADCITFKDSVGADAVLRTKPRSPEERTAARALAPTLGGCLAEGQQISLTAENIRAVVADGLWSRFGYGSKPHA
jgi:hypothetical protein